MNKVIVQFIKNNGMFVVGDTTQLTKEEAEKELKMKRIIVLEGEVQEAPAKLKNMPPLPQNINLICAICGKEFKTEQKLEEHKKKVHGVE
jgi:hypothetical protein